MIRIAGRWGKLAHTLPFREKQEADMTYEEYLDEVTTLITELYDVTDADAIKWVVQAQANEFFVAHDEQEAMRTQERAVQDARTIFKQRKKSARK